MSIGGLVVVVLIGAHHSSASCLGCLHATIDPIDECTATEFAARRASERILERDLSSNPFTPKMDEAYFEATGVGALVRGSVIARSRTSVVFTALFRGTPQHETFVVKTDCLQRIYPGPVGVDPVPSGRRRFRSLIFSFSIPAEIPGLDDDLIREYALSMALEDSGIVPAPLWLSGPVTCDASLAHLRNPKMQFAMSPAARNLCIALEAQVRFLVFEKVGVSVAKYMKLKQARYVGDDAAYLRDVIAIGRKGLALLRRLHERGVVHGDIHAGSIAFRSIEAVPEELESCENEEFVLIDLGLAALVCGDQKRRATPAFAAFHLLSPWQLRGAGLRGFRDDVFRLFELLADLIGFGHYHQQLSAFVEENLSVPERVFFIKENLRLFGRNDPLFVGNSIIAFNAFGSYAGFDHVQDLLESCMRHVLSLATPGSPVDYEFLDSALLEAANLLSTSSSFVESLVPDLLGYA